LRSLQTEDGQVSRESKLLRSSSVLVSLSSKMQRKLKYPTRRVCRRKKTDIHVSLANKMVDEGRTEAPQYISQGIPRDRSTEGKCRSRSKSDIHQGVTAQTPNNYRGEDEHYAIPKTDIHTEVDRPWKLKEDQWHGLRKPMDPVEAPASRGTAAEGDHHLKRTDIHCTDPRDPAPAPPQLPAKNHKRLSDIHVYGNTYAGSNQREARTYTCRLETNSPTLQFGRNNTDLHGANSALGPRLNGEGQKVVPNPQRMRSDIHGDRHKIAMSSTECGRDFARCKSDLHNGQEAPWGSQQHPEALRRVPRRHTKASNTAGDSKGDSAANCLFFGQSRTQQKLDQHGHEVVMQWATNLRSQPY